MHGAGRFTEFWDQEFQWQASIFGINVHVDGSNSWVVARGGRRDMPLSEQLAGDWRAGMHPRELFTGGPLTSRRYVRKFNSRQVFCMAVGRKARGIGAVVTAPDQSIPAAMEGYFGWSDGRKHPVYGRLREESPTASS
jgi:hypothetical protein